MTSTPVVILTFRSNLESDRPQAAIVQYGQMAINAASGDGGFYFEDSAGAIRKIGPNHLGAVAPNTNFIGSSGNSYGETWTDDSSPERYFRVWDGSTWSKISASFADTASFANTATLSSGSILASGAVTADSTTFAQTALLASGAILASGAVFANTATLSSGSILASGAVFADTATLSSGSILASGAVFADTSTLSSGTILASGAVSSITVIASGLPDPTSVSSGTAYLTTTLSGAFPSGLYVRAVDGWFHIL